MDRLTIARLTGLFQVETDCLVVPGPVDETKQIFHDIKMSFAKGGVRQSLDVVDADPDLQRVVVAAHCRKRARAIQLLWRETRDPRFETVFCRFADQPIPDQGGVR